MERERERGKIQPICTYMYTYNMNQLTESKEVHCQWGTGSTEIGEHPHHSDKCGGGDNGRRNHKLHKYE